MTQMGTQADVARSLGISREAVRKQIKNRDRTGAPTPNEAGLYDVEEYRSWYVNDFKPKSGPRRGVKAEES